jgi:hypothetical protein
LDINNYQEANLLFTCYAVFLALGHTLLFKTIKSATIDNYLRAAANVVKRAGSQVPNPTNNLRWHNPLLDMTTGKCNSQISSILAEVQRWKKCQIVANPSLSTWYRISSCSVQQTNLTLKLQQCTTGKSLASMLAIILPNGLNVMVLTSS